VSRSFEEQVAKLLASSQDRRVLVKAMAKLIREEERKQERRERMRSFRKK
jgi:hypothetical protein